VRVRGRFPRIPCVVPGCSCGATCYPDASEIICPKHYRPVDRRLKALRRRVKYLARRRGFDRDHAWCIDDWLWARVRRQAIGRAAGI
jgi:hypothetical protein